MRVETRMPLIFRGKTKRGESERRVYTTNAATFEIPEYSYRDAETAFLSRKRTIQLAGRANDPTYLGEPENHETRILEIEGKLYRKVENNSIDRTFKNAYALESLYTETNRPFKISNVIVWERENTNQWNECLYANLVSFLRQRIEYRMDPESRAPYFYGVKKTLNMNTRDVRNASEWATVRPLLSSFEEDDVEYNLAIHRDLISQVIMIDGETWIETLPPAISVERLFGSVSVSTDPQDGTKSFGQVVNSIQIEIGNPTDVHVNQLICSIRRPEQFETAYEEMQNFMNSRNIWQSRLDLSGEYELSDSPLLDYDYERFTMNRFAMAIAFENWRSIGRYPDRLERLSVSDRQHIHDAYIEASKTNPVINDFGDMADYLSDGLRIWKAGKRRCSHFSFFQQPMSDFYADRALKASEDRDVSLPMSNFPNKAPTR